MVAKVDWYKVGLFVLFCTVLLAGYWWLYEVFSFERIRGSISRLETVIENHYGLALSIFFAFYTIITALGLPIVLVVTMVGGFLFGCKQAFIMTVLASTLGGLIAFPIIRLWAQRYIKRRFGGYLEKFQEYFQRSALYYVFALHFIPIVPFGAITALAAFSPMRLITFVWSTFFATMPGAWVYSCAGSQLKSLAHTGVAGPENKAILIFSLIGFLLLVYAIFVTLKMPKKSSS